MEIGRREQEAELVGSWARCTKFHLIASFVSFLPQAEISCGPPFTVEEAGKGGSWRIEYPVA